MIRKAKDILIDLDKGISEEATKIYLVLPFIMELGYDIFDPKDIIPEYKPVFYTGNDRVDFALCDDYMPKIYVEVKRLGNELSEKEVSWLAKYFNSDPYIKLGILTNGDRYLFFTDSKHRNLMDKEPFYEFELSRYSKIDEYMLGYFNKGSYNEQCIENCMKTYEYINTLTKGFMQVYKDTYNKPKENVKEYNQKYMEWLYGVNSIDTDYLPYSIAEMVIPLSIL